MLNIGKAKLDKIKLGFDNKKIAVIGDMMLDSYFWGDVHRISPEAPVPVVDVDREFDRFGGAANVAHNIAKLGGVPIPLGIIGNDENGIKFNQLLKESNIPVNSIIVSENRHTTCKTRVIAENQQIVRVDKENKNPISTEEENEILSILNSSIKELDAIILEDYNKGVLTERLIEEVISIANKNNKIITVDPKFHNFEKYKNVTVFKPNRKEASDILGFSLKNEDQINKAGQLLLENLNAKFILLTLGKEGIALFEKGKEAKRLPTKARNVADVSGAGDTVISTLTIALVADANIYEAAYLANYAGGIVCETAGIIAIEKDILFETVLKNGINE